MQASLSASESTQSVEGDRLVPHMASSPADGNELCNRSATALVQKHHTHHYFCVDRGLSLSLCLPQLCALSPLREEPGFLHHRFRLKRQKLTAEATRLSVVPLAGHGTECLVQEPV